jgi:hypothetical protein
MLISKAQTKKILESCMPDAFVCKDCMEYAGHFTEYPDPEVRGTMARCYVCWNRKPCHTVSEWRGEALRPAK